MLANTKAIVLKYINYTNNSIIVFLFTKQFGKQTYIIKGVRNKKSKNKINLFQALNILEIESIQKARSDIHTLKETKATYNFNNIASDISKIAIAFFIAEILYKLLKENESDPDLFNFIENFIINLEENQNINNYHIIFLVRLTAYIGIFPNIDELQTVNDVDYAKIFDKILKSDKYNIDLQEINNSSRNKILKIILNYYHIHIPNFNKLKSLEVLESVFS